MRHWGSLLALVLLAGCSSAPEKPKPSVLAKLATPIAVSVGAKQNLGGGVDLTGLSPALEGGQIAAAGRSGRVMLLDASMNPLWRVELKTPLVGGAALDATAVYVIAADGRLFALHRADGTTRFAVQLPDASHVPAVVDGGLVFVKTVNGQLLALDAETGAIRWVEEVAEASMGIQGGSPMSLDNGILRVLWESGRLVSYEAASGRILWERQVALPRGRNPVSRIVDSKGAPSVRNGLLATASRNSQVSVLDLQSGQLVWSAESDAYPGAIVAFNAVIAVETDGTVVSYSAQTGETLWAQSGLRYRELSPPAVADSLIAVGDLAGYVHLLNPADGAFVGRVRVASEKIQVAPVMTEQGLLVQTVDGTVARVEWPR